MDTLREIDENTFLISDTHLFHDYRCDINIHGHVHSKTIDHPRLINVSFEAIGFKPIRLKELLERKASSL